MEGFESLRGASHNVYNRLVSNFCSLKRNCLSYDLENARPEINAFVIPGHPQYKIYVPKCESDSQSHFQM